MKKAVGTKKIDGKPFASKPASGATSFPVKSAAACEQRPARSSLLSPNEKHVRKERQKGHDEIIAAAARTRQHAQIDRRGRRNLRQPPLPSLRPRCKNPVVAIDTNSPCCQGDDTAIEALNIVLERMRPAEILVPPRFKELLHQAENDPDRRQRALAEKACCNCVPLAFPSADLNSVQEPSLPRPRGRFCLPDHSRRRNQRRQHHRRIRVLNSVLLFPMIRICWS